MLEEARTHFGYSFCMSQSASIPKLCTNRPTLSMPISHTVLNSPCVRIGVSTSNGLSPLRVRRPCELQQDGAGHGARVVRVGTVHQQIHQPTHLEITVHNPIVTMNALREIISECSTPEHYHTPSACISCPVASPPVGWLHFTRSRRMDFGD